MRKQLTRYFSLLSISVLALISLSIPTAHAAFNPNLLIDDNIFNNSSSMSASQINSWLNTYFPSSCISTHNGFSSPDPTGYSPSNGFTYGGNVSGGQVVSDAAQAYGLNPEVLLATLQKESSVVSGTASYGCQYINTAMGYGCPDSGSCPTNPATESGFSKQVIHAAWLFKFGQQRSLGNTSWDVQSTNFPQSGDYWDNSDDPQSCYGGPMTQGNFMRCSTDSSTVYYDGITTIDGSSVQIESGGTAALYYYTPHFSGNENFVNLYTEWFGDPTSPCDASADVGGATSGRQIVGYRYNTTGPADLAFTQLNNTGSACAEVHVWNPGTQTWLTHIATGMKATDPSAGMWLPMTSPGSNHTSMTYILYSGAGGFAEVHKLSPDLQTFPGYYDVSTDLTNVSPSTGTFVAGDFFGRGYDQLAYILYDDSTGNVEIHIFNPTLQRAIGYYDVKTDLTGVNASTGTFVAGDFFGRGYDQLAYVEYAGSSGHTEVHVFDPTLQRAIGYYDVSTDLTNVSPSTGTFVARDFLGRGYSQLTYVEYDGSSGNVETHMFDPTLQRAIGFQDIVTNLAGFNPAQ
jgi:hypothetical protein